MSVGPRKTGNKECPICDPLGNAERPAPQCTVDDSVGVLEVRLPAQAKRHGFAFFVQLALASNEQAACQSGILDFSYDKVKNHTVFNLLLPRRRHYSTQTQNGTKIGCQADDAPPPWCSHRLGCGVINVLRERPFNQGNKVGASSGP